METNSEFKASACDGRETVLTEGVLEAFKASFYGDLLTANDQGYDDVREIWNKMHDKRPALIARCSGVADVITAINFARNNNLLIAVRGGGHNVADK